jgi:hypothetical protein
MEMDMERERERERTSRVSEEVGEPPSFFILYFLRS